MSKLPQFKSKLPSFPQSSTASGSINSKRPISPLDEETTQSPAKKATLSRSNGNAGSTTNLRGAERKFGGKMLPPSVTVPPKRMMRRSVSMANINRNPISSLAHNSRPVVKSPSLDRLKRKPLSGALSNSSLRTADKTATTSTPLNAAASRRRLNSFTGKVNSQSTTSIRKPLYPLRKTENAKANNLQNSVPADDLAKRIEDVEKKLIKMDKVEYGRLSTENLNPIKESLSKVLQEKDDLNKENILLKDRESSNNEKIHQLEMDRDRDRSTNECLKLDLNLKQTEIFEVKKALSEAMTAKMVVSCELDSANSQLSAEKARSEQLTTEVQQLKEEIAALNRAAIEGEVQRKKLHNMVQDLKGNIRVFCRMRPMLGEEPEKNSNYLLNVTSDTALEVIKDTPDNCSTSSNMKGRGGSTEFNFDKVFVPANKQEDVFREVSELVQSAMDGFNVCVFAYGQTGSGKTFTMTGSEEQPGIIPRTTHLIFEEVQRLQKQGWNYEVEASILEIYNETIRDLLVDPAKWKENKYEVQQTAQAKCSMFKVSNLKTVVVDSTAQIQQLLLTAREHRAVAATNINQHSSRSHLVFRLGITGSNQGTGEEVQGSLNLVDLAGSERLKDSGAKGARLVETQNINASLSKLTSVIMAIAKKQSHVPYRDSRLTHLLQPCLGGSSKTLMLVNISPLDTHIGETLNSLRFASIANSCHIGAAGRVAKKTA